MNIDEFIAGPQSGDCRLLKRLLNLTPAPDTFPV
jgi:hypothetical protein